MREAGDWRQETNRRAVWLGTLVLAGLAYAWMLHPYLFPPEGYVDPWIAYTPETLREYRADNRLVFLDATAAWCLTCQANEKLVLDSDRVQAAFRELDVVLIKADFTKKDQEVADLLASFGRRGVPLYVVFPSNGGKPIALPEAITPGLVLDVLHTATGKNMASR